MGMAKERIVVVGGGVGGLTTALALGRAGHPVTILERDPLPATADAETTTTPPTVTGVRLDDGSIVEGDVVVASTGRRGAVPAWLHDIGVEVGEEIRESGLMYLSRWYRLPPDYDLLSMDPKLGGDL